MKTFYVEKPVRKVSITLGLLLLAIIIYFLLTSNSVKSALDALTPPELPKLQTKHNGQWMNQVWLSQNWGNQTNKPSSETLKYHYLSQGTRTLPLPYEWIVALEQPNDSVLGALLGFNKGLFMDNDYILRFGFIRGTQDPVHNPDGLPIGFARTPSQNLAGITYQVNAIGFTCAGCHTGHLVYDNGINGPQEYIIEGGPATTDLGLFGSALTATLGQTILSSKLGPMDHKFDRFARRVLGKEYGPATKLKLSNELFALAKSQLDGGGDIIEVTEGFTRLDALNRIGNSLFGDVIHRPENIAPIDAPVNYPHIWTAPWFNWVQYDGSVMGPLVRNVGEAMGVKAWIDVNSPADDNRFSSSIPVENLVWMESFLSGKEPTPETGFNGLKEPQWKLTEINPDLAKQGEDIYKKHCQGCHLPSVNSQEIFAKTNFDHITWKNHGLKESSPEKVLQLKLIPLEQIGTDPAQASVMVERTINTSGSDTGTIVENVPGMGLDTAICVRDADQLTKETLFPMTRSYQKGYYDEPPLAYDSNQIDLVSGWVKDGANVPFGYALAAAVEQGIDAWFIRNQITDPKLQERIKGNRPNCIQAGWGYKARPLNGVWATPPFLHNGSVATIRDLICPTDGTRPRFVQLGSQQYDAKNLGIKQPTNYQKVGQMLNQKGELYDKQGLFLLDTHENGNLATGHHFSSEYDQSLPYWRQKKGVIGPKLSEQQCDAVLEYLKII